MKAVILESYAVKPGDLCWDALKPLIPQLTVYETTPYTDFAEISARIGDAEMVLINKCHITQTVLDACPALKWVGIIATGTDNIDLAACTRHGVKVANVPGYSTYSVAQMVFSLLLAVCQSVDRFDRGVKDGYWKQPPEAYGLLPLTELCGKTFGVYGYGAIGRQTAKIAKALGMRVLACTRTIRPEYAADGTEFVPLDTLLAQCDVLSLHCPATPQTINLIDAAALTRIKRGCILINTARGSLVEENAVAAALETGALAWYLCDAYRTEPLPKDSPLMQAPHTLLTPHVAWATAEALENLEAITLENVKSYLAGKPQHIVNE